MHFTLVLLLCSFISVSTAKNDFHTEDDVAKLKEGQIVGAKPSDFLVSRHYTIGHIIIR